ncbi:MAG TPA: hypothetical protein DCY20_01970 [Firmicutes bacterium]|nr:hypothetical protein [Bacillota bacterium]
MERLYSVSLCMIVKDEERVLKRCLDSVVGLVDEIVIVDTGSTDNTINIAKSFNAIVKPFVWTNDFSEARNYSLSFATCDWILVLDADEYFSDEAKSEFIQAINQDGISGYYINQINFIDEMNLNHTINNLMHRLFRNHQGAVYTGAVHEQLYIPEDKKLGGSKIIELGFYHDGYLTPIYAGKQKSNRNTKLIQAILEKDPNNTFQLFNLGTEYVGAKEFDKAIECYNKAYSQMTQNDGFVGKLILYRINAFMTKGDYSNALQAIEEGLTLFPNYTDLMFEKAEIYEQYGQYTKAIRCYEQCMAMGMTPINLRYSSLVWEIGPLIRLSKLYQKLEDYEMAIKYYIDYFKTPGANYLLLYPFGLCLKKEKYAEEAVCDILSSYLKIDELESFIVFLNLLLNNEYFSRVDSYLNHWHAEIFDTRLEELKIKSKFYLREFEEVKRMIEDKKDVSTDLETIYFIVAWMTSSINVNQIGPLLDSKYYQFLRRLVIYPEVEQDISYGKDSPELDLLFRLLKETILIKEFTLFERLLYALNYFETDDVLLRLAKLYDEFGFYDLAKKEIFRSIKHFDKLDLESAKLLCKYLT